MELIRQLIEMRRGVLEQLRTYPEPDARGRYVRVYQPGFRPDVPPWKEIDDSKQKIMLEIAKGRKNGKQIWHEVGGSYNVVRRNIAELVNAGLIKRIGNSGYVIARVPMGAPPEILAAWEGKART